MERDEIQGENTAPPESEATVPTPAEIPESGQPDALAAAERRIAELNGQLDEMRAVVERQLAELGTENAGLLAAYSELARSLPGLVPELVGGASLEAVRQSVAAAREAYSRIAASLTPAEAGNGANPGLFTGAGAGGGSRGGPGAEEDQQARSGPGRGVNLIYQALAGGKNGNLAR